MSLIALGNLKNGTMIRSRKKNNLILWLVEPFHARYGQGHQPDFVLLFFLTIIIVSGLLFLSAASSTLAFNKYGDSFFHLRQQITHGVLPGLILFYAALRINYDWLRKLAPWLLVGALGVLILVLVTNLGNSFGTARSWIVIGNYTFQPSELVKIFFIIFLAAWFERLGPKVKELSKATIPFVIIVGLLGFLLIMQPDVGTLTIITLVSLAMFFAAGAKKRHLAVLILLGFLALVVLIKMAPYRAERVTAWLNPDSDPQNIGYQIRQSLIAVGSGGLLGHGLGASLQKSYLPQPANDAIFGVMAEEIGFVFCFLVILTYAIIIHRGFKIARQAPDNFAKLMAIGISSWIAFQVFINIAGMIQLAPLTGVPLPFISLGGSNLIASLFALGLLANISKLTIHDSR